MNLNSFTVSTIFIIFGMGNGLFDAWILLRPVQNYCSKNPIQMGLVISNTILHIVWQWGIECYGCEKTSPQIIYLRYTTWCMWHCNYSQVILVVADLAPGHLQLPWWCIPVRHSRSTLIILTCWLTAIAEAVILVPCRGWVGLWGFLWWAPSAKRKDHHGVSSGWSSVWHRSNTGLSSTQYEQIPIIPGVWPFWLTPFFFRSITFWRAYG